jgi:HEPN domain-containing protein
MKSRSEAFLKEAQNKLKLAKEEMFKPVEDIVSYSICKNSQFAIENYLKGFLATKKTQLKKDETIASLYNKCIAIDKNFESLDMGTVGCKNHPIDSRYCSEINSVNACFDAADNIDTFLRKNNII